MKVAIVYPNFYGVGGIARYLNSFLDNLPEDSEKIIVITNDTGKFDLGNSRVNLIHIHAPDHRLGLVFWGIKVRFELLRLYKEGLVDCVNFHFPPMIPGLFLPFKIPTVLTVHSTYKGMADNFGSKVRFSDDWNFFSLRVKTLMERYLFSRCKAVTTLNTKGLKELELYNYKKPVSIVPNGVDIDLFNAKNNQDKIYDLIFCGRIEEMKGSRSMVDICRGLIEKRPSVRICIIGYGNDEKYVKDNLAVYKNVDFLGKVAFSDVPRYYAVSKVYASASFYEGLPGTCLESMSTGLPAVGWDLPFYDQVITNHSNGRVIPVGKIDDYIEAVDAILSNEVTMQEFGAAARKAVVDNYSWKSLSVLMLGAFKGSVQQSAILEK